MIGKKEDCRSKLQRKADLLGSLSGCSVKKRNERLKKYYKSQSFYKRYKLRMHVQRIIDKNIKFLYLDALRWIYVDLIRGRSKRSFGIYQFIALPGEGKTMSMVAHMERYRVRMQKEEKGYVIATNFNYIHQDYQIEHWIDIVKIAHECYNKGIHSLIAMDEIHVTFDSTEWKDFPAELLAVLSFVRKYGMEFLVSAQIYERIPKKIRDIANFTVVCKNVLHLDRFFRNYYFEKDTYEMDFADTKGKKKKAKFVREFVASDDFYKLYNTKQQVERMVVGAKEEKKRREEASYILYKSPAEE